MSKSSAPIRHRSPEAAFFDDDQRSATEQHAAPSSSKVRNLIRNALHRWKNARDLGRLRQQLDERVLSEIGLTKLPSAMDKISGVAVELLGAPTYKENDQC